MKLSSSFLSKAFAALLVSTAANTVNATAFQVTNTNDLGAGSLRQAITDSNASDSSADTITFGVTGTITLNSGLPAISSSGGALTITGPGDTLLTINGNQGDFSIFSVASGGNLFISGVTVSGAHFTSAARNLNNYGGVLSITKARCLYQIPPFRIISPLVVAEADSITTMAALSPYQIPLSQIIPLKASAVVGAPSSASER
jgi:hypothetical protein